MLLKNKKYFLPCVGPTPFDNFIQIINIVCVTLPPIFFITATYFLIKELRIKRETSVAERKRLFKKTIIYFAIGFFVYLICNVVRFLFSQLLCL